MTFARTLGLDADGDRIDGLHVVKVLGEHPRARDGGQELEVLQRGALADEDEVDAPVGHVREGRQARVGAVGAAGHDHRHDGAELALHRHPAVVCAAFAACEHESMCGRLGSTHARSPTSTSIFILAAELIRDAHALPSMSSLCLHMALHPSQANESFTLADCQSPEDIMLTARQRQVTRAQPLHICQLQAQGAPARSSKVPPAKTLVCAGHATPAFEHSSQFTLHTCFAVKLLARVASGKYVILAR